MIKLTPVIRDLAIHVDSGQSVRADMAIILAERFDRLVTTMLAQIDYLVSERAKQDKVIANLEQRLAMERAG